MDIIEVCGNIIEADVDVIAQQCNCLTVKSHGLSKTISDKMNVDLYKFRRKIQYKSNLAIESDRGIPGTCQLFKNNSNFKPRYVACLLGQFAPGKPGIYYKEVSKLHQLVDDEYQRILWFEKSLKHLFDQMKHYELDSIAFPKFIGCGLAGGNWEKYYSLIKEFTIYSGFTVYIVNYNEN